MTAGPLGWEDAGTGPVLVLVHGFPFDRRMWAHQLAGLAGVRRVVAVDLRGRGLSPLHPGDEAAWTIDDHADDVARTIEEVAGGEPADVGGLSMGGYVVFALLRRHPDLVRSVLLLSTRAAPDTPEARVVRDEQASRVLAEGTGTLAEAMIPRLLGPAAADDVRALVHRMFDETPGPTAAADLVAMRDRPDATPQLGSLGVPALVVHGTDDRAVPLEAAEAMAAAITGASFDTVPGAGHLAPLERPQAANAAIGRFLQGA